MFPSHLPSVVKEVLDCSLSYVGVAISQVNLFQELIAPEEVTLEMPTAHAIPPALVPALDPELTHTRHTGQVA